MINSGSGDARTGHLHAVRFYESTGSLSRIVGEFLGEGVTQGSPALMIARPDHCAAIEEDLRTRGFDVEGMSTSGHLTVVDAERTLRKFMRDDMPDSGLFKQTMLTMLGTIGGGRETRAIRAYGEMVDLLWQAGRTVAAVKLEMLWNELAQTQDFSLLCGYSMGHFYKSASIDEICQQHTHVVSANGELGVVK